MRNENAATSHRPRELKNVDLSSAPIPCRGRENGTPAEEGLDDADDPIACCVGVAIAAVG
jgi:hypothetical protein